MPQCVIDEERRERGRFSRSLRLDHQASRRRRIPTYRGMEQNRTQETQAMLARTAKDCLGRPPILSWLFPLTTL